MGNLYNRIQALCIARGITGYKLCQDLGMSKSFMTELRKGRTKSIKIETATKIANYFHVPVEQLLSESTAAQPSSLHNAQKPDISQELESLHTLLEQNQDLLFSGHPMTDEARRAVLNAIELGLSAAKLKNGD